MPMVSFPDSSTSASVSPEAVEAVLSSLEPETTSSVEAGAQPARTRAAAAAVVPSRTRSEVRAGRSVTVSFLRCIAVSHDRIAAGAAHGSVGWGRSGRRSIARVRTLHPTSGRGTAIPGCRRVTPAGHRDPRGTTPRRRPRPPSDRSPPRARSGGTASPARAPSRRRRRAGCRRSRRRRRSRTCARACSSQTATGWSLPVCPGKRGSRGSPPPKTMASVPAGRPRSSASTEVSFGGQVVAQTIVPTAARRRTSSSRSGSSISRWPPAARSLETDGFRTPSTSSRMRAAMAATVAAAAVRREAGAPASVGGCSLRPSPRWGTGLARARPDPRGLAGAGDRRLRAVPDRPPRAGAARPRVPGPARRRGRCGSRRRASP